MDPAQHTKVPPLPEGLSRQLLGVERELRRWEAVRLGASAMVGLSAVGISAFWMDRLGETPAWLRGSILIGSVGWFGFEAARFLKPRFWRPRDFRSLSRLVQRRFSRLGDRLLGVVEISGSQQLPGGFSSELFRAALDQVAEQASTVDFTEAVNRQPTRRFLQLASALLAAAVFPTVLVPSVGMNAWQRGLAPWAGVERQTLVGITGLPVEVSVPRGEAVSVSGGLRFVTSWWRPSTLRWNLGAADGSVAANGTAQWSAVLPGVTEEASVRLRVGDTSASIRLHPVLRPGLSSLTSRLELPEYLGYPTLTQAVQAASVSVVEGGSVEIFGETTRGLVEGSLIETGGARAPLSVSSNTFHIVFAKPDMAREVRIVWRDQLGLTNALPTQITIQPVADLAPSAELMNAVKDGFALETEVLSIKSSAHDDFGIKEFGLICEVLGSTNQSMVSSNSDWTFAATNRNSKTLETSFQLNPALAGASAGSVLSMRPYAVDFYPGREPVYGVPMKIMILGVDQHAEIIRQKLESLQARVEELARLQEKISAQTAALEQGKLDSKEATRRTEELKEAQEQTAAQLKKMSEDGASTLKEAMRNPSLDAAKLEEWNKAMAEMKRIAESPMKGAAEKLAAAASPSSDRKEKVDEAREKQKEAEAALAQLQKKMNKGLDNLQALTLAQRLRALGGRHESLEKTLLAKIDDVIGLKVEEMSAAQRTGLEMSKEEQSDNHKDSAKLGVEISRFFERTHKDNYGVVSKEIKEKRVGEEMERIRDLIGANVSMEASQELDRWAKQFVAWADVLQPQPKKDAAGSESGGGKGAGGPPPSPMEQFIEMLRLRELQSNVRERTRMLERQKDQPSIYDRSVKRLAESQEDVSARLDDVMLKGAPMAVVPPLREARDNAGQALSRLRQPATDAPTVEVQEHVVDALTDAINLINEEQQKQQQQQGQAGAGSSAAEEMAMLMQAMAPKPGEGMAAASTPGGSMAGGTTTDRPAALTGNATGRAEELRNIQKASGTATEVPAEYREALQQFYKLIEQEPN